MHLKFLFVVGLMATMVTGAGALTIGASGTNNNSNNNLDYSNGLVSSGSINADDAAKLQVISTLENDILLLQAELKKCEKGKKGWIAATVIGSAGVVATGVAAGVQGAQLSKKKAELKSINADVASKQQELNSINNGGK